MQCQTLGEAGLSWVPLGMTTQTVTLMDGHLSSQESMFRRVGFFLASSSECRLCGALISLARSLGGEGPHSWPRGFDFTCLGVCVSPGLLVMDDGGGGLGLFLISKMTLRVRLREKCSPEPLQPWIFLLQV